MIEWFPLALKSTHAAKKNNKKKMLAEILTVFFQLCWHHGCLHYKDLEGSTLKDTCISRK